MPKTSNDDLSRKTDLPNRSLRKTGAAIFLTIFLIEFGLFTTLAYLDHEAEQRAVQEESRSDFLRIVFSVLENSALTWTTEVGHISHSRSANLKISPQDYRVQSQKSFEEIEKLPFKSERSQSICVELKELVDSQAETFDKLDELGAESGVSFLKYASRYKIISHALSRTKSIAAKINSSMEQELSDYLHERQRETHRRDVFKWSLVVVVIFQLLLAVVVITLFFKGVTARLTLLVENARHLPLEAGLPYIVVGDDELMQLDEALHATADLLKQAASRRRAIISMVANDIRNPLTTAIAQVEKLIEIEKNFLSAEKLKTTLLTEKRLVDDLLRAEKLDAGAMGMVVNSFDLSEVLAEIVALTESACARKGLHMTVSCEHIQIAADRNRIFQVLNNLVSNAIKFSIASGKIAVNCSTSKSRLLVKVSDTGCGFDPKDKSKIFDRFYQSQSSGQNSAGYGLGLSICKTIIHKHGGHISARSLGNYGSTFWFVIPYGEKIDSDIR